MNKILSYVRRCVEDYDMIQAGDRVAVGVSGGKDSLTLLVALARLREFYPKPFTVEAYTLDMGHVDGGEGMDFTGVEALCRELDVPFTLLHSEIHHIIFDLRKEKNPRYSSVFLGSSLAKGTMAPPTLMSPWPAGALST
mgnify:CR=1 FL=1